MVHCFDVEIAEKYGVNAAIILYNFNFWIEKNKADEMNCYDGNYWTYASKKSLSASFPYLTERQIRTALDKLREDGILVAGNYNKNPYDKTNWYSITEKGTSMLQKSPIDVTELKKGTSIGLESPTSETKKSDRLDFKVQPIPDITRYNNKDNNINIKEKCEKEKTAFFGDKELDEAFKEFLQMRNKIKKPLATKQALTRMRNKIEKLSGGDIQLAIKIINQSTDHCWQDVFELKDYGGWDSGWSKRGDGDDGRKADGGFEQDSSQFETDEDYWDPEWDSLGRC